MSRRKLCRKYRVEGVRMALKKYVEQGTRLKVAAIELEEIPLRPNPDQLKTQQGNETGGTEPRRNSGRTGIHVLTQEKKKSNQKIYGIGKYWQNGKKERENHPVSSKIKGREGGKARAIFQRRAGEE